MAQKLRRDTPGVRRQARAQENTRRVARARTHTRSVFGRFLVLLPFTDEQLRRAFTGLILAGVAVLAFVVAQAAGLTQFAQAQFAHATAQAGFEVRHIELRGAQRIDALAIRERALGERDLAMASYDIEALRRDLLAMPWVKDARVARQLPDVLVIDIIERTPHAVARRADRLMLVDAGGIALEPISAEAARTMLLLEGFADPSEGSADERALQQDRMEAQMAALNALLNAAPALRSQVQGAQWVGNRRWNLTFKTGQQLALPEGEPAAAAAIVAFARADGVHRLIGGDVVTFDLRNAPLMYLGKPGRSEEMQMPSGEQS